jgi:hypothetical protein
MITEYVWNYNIKVKDKNGEYIYEKETLEHLLEILKQHPDYEEVQAKHIGKVLKKTYRNIERVNEMWRNEK